MMPAAHNPSSPSSLLWMRQNVERRSGSRETTLYADMERRAAGSPSALTFTALLCYHSEERSPAAQVMAWQRRKDLRKGKRVHSSHEGQSTG